MTASTTAKHSHPSFALNTDNLLHIILCCFFFRLSTRTHSEMGSERKWKHAGAQRTDSEALGNIITCSTTLRQQQRKIHCKVPHPQWIINCIRFRRGRCAVYHLVFEPISKCWSKRLLCICIYIHISIENEAVTHWHSLCFGIEALNLVFRYVRLCRMEVIGGEYSRRSNKAAI